MQGNVPHPGQNVFHLYVLFSLSKISQVRHILFLQFLCLTFLNSGCRCEGRLTPSRSNFFHFHAVFDKKIPSGKSGICHYLVNIREFVPKEVAFITENIRPSLSYFDAKKSDPKVADSHSKLNMCKPLLLKCFLVL